MTTLTTGAVLIIGAAACVTDLHSRRIPNWLTFGASAVAIAYQFATAGQVGVQHAMGGWVVGLVLFMPLFLLNGMGAGDVKLLAALGAWLGPADATHLAMYASIAGGLIAVPLAIRHRYLGTAFTNLGSLAKFWWYCGIRPLRRVSLDGGTGPRLAYAVPVFFGAVVTLWLR
jgi:prepilin peptidase CpaA